MEPNDNFDDFDTQIQSDELIPDGYEDRDDGEPYEVDPPLDIDYGHDYDYDYPF
jgi:hypothetical protein